MADELLQIRVTADFKEAEGAFLRLAKVATSFESNIRSISANLNRDFNRINGMAELFGDTSNVVADKMEALKRAMNSLMTNGFQALNPEVQKLKQQYDALGATLTPIVPKINQVKQAVSGGGDTVKKSNQQWTNFALILQDLPYGFRGIQNNLPAVVGGFAGMTGGIYFAASAIIAFFTAWDSGIIKFGNSVKLSTDYAKEAATAYSNESVKLDSLFRVATDVNVAMGDRIKAAKTLKEEYPGLLSLYSAEDITLGKADEAYKKLTITLWQYAKAKAAETTLQEIGAKQNKLLLEKADILDNYSDSIINSKSKMAGYTSVNGILVKTESDYVVALKAKKDLLDQNTKAYDNLEAIAKKYVTISDQNINASGDLAVMKGDDKATKAKTKALEDQAAAQKKYAAEKKRTLEEVNKLEVEGYVSTLSLQQKEEYATNKKFVDLEAKAKEYGLSTIGLEEARLKEINSIKEKYDLIEKDRSEKSIKSNAEWESQIAIDSTKAMIDIREAEAKEKKKILDREFQNEMDAIQNRLDAQLKSHRKEPVKQQSDYNQAIAGYILMAMQAGKTAEEIDKLQDKINKVKSTAEGTASAFTPLADALNSIGKELASSIGDNLGKMLSGTGGISELLNGFLGVLADGLIKVGQLAIATGFAIDGIKEALKSLNPVVAVAAGIALVALGSYVKSSLSKSSDNLGGGQKFANGGIISGPTMGLMGEYPGAKSNPEVVAPLDKLKSMIGGGGNGEFVLRGSDLVLALQRSNYSLNLRRGS
jgi:hypothetical protein